MAIEQLAEEVVNEVATNLEEAAEVTRKINTAGLSYFAVGIGIGAVVGFYFGYKLNREKIRAEAYRETEIEIAKLREIYLEKTETLAKESPDEEVEPRGMVPIEKPPISEVVEQLGYSKRTDYHEVSTARTESPERPLPAPVPILDDLPENPVETSKSMNAGWNYERELASRSPDSPYVIHQNEYTHSNPNYSKNEFHYYSLDDVMVDGDDNDILRDVEGVVGLENLKFGHGSDDINVVYVRNDHLEMDMQITRLNESFEEAVLGLDGAGNDEDDDDDS
jgi:hypothetical protein